MYRDLLPQFSSRNRMKADALVLLTVIDVVLGLPGINDWFLALYRIGVSTALALDLGNLESKLWDQALASFPSFLLLGFGDLHTEAAAIAAAWRSCFPDIMSDGLSPRSARVCIFLP